MRLLPRQIVGSSHKILTDAPEPISLLDKLPKNEKKEQNAPGVRELSPADTIWVYSDGSRDNEGQTGVVWAVYCGEEEQVAGYGRCGLWRDIVDAEAIAALCAIESAIKHALTNTRNIHLCTDNQAVAIRIANPDKNGTSGTSQNVIEKNMGTAISMAAQRCGRCPFDTRAPGHSWKRAHDLARETWYS